MGFSAQLQCTKQYFLSSFHSQKSRRSPFSVVEYKATVAQGKGEEVVVVVVVVAAICCRGGGGGSRKII